MWTDGVACGALGAHPGRRRRLRPPHTLELLHTPGEIARGPRRALGSCVRRGRRVRSDEQREVDRTRRHLRKLDSLGARRRGRLSGRPFARRRRPCARARIGDAAAARAAADVRGPRGGLPLCRPAHRRADAAPARKGVDRDGHNDEQADGHRHHLHRHAARVNCSDRAEVRTMFGQARTRLNCSSSFLIDTPVRVPSSWAKSWTRNSSIIHRRASSSGSTTPRSSCWLFRSR